MELHKEMTLTAKPNNGKVLQQDLTKRSKAPVLLQNCAWRRIKDTIEESSIRFNKTVKSTGS
jgi:hypothetical protein